MNVAHFYHLYAAGDWRDPLAEHLAALKDSGFDGRFVVGIVGTPAQRAEAVDELNVIRPPDRVTLADEGWEQVTLREVRRYAKRNPQDAVLYAHTKGAWDSSPINVAWRRSMSAHVVYGWKAAASALAECSELDAVGCHWLTEEEFPGASAGTPVPCFGGNYWMAACAYLRQLPPCAANSRHDAEGWIGLRDPRVLDLTPGWPGTFGRTRYARLIAGRVAA